MRNKLVVELLLLRISALEATQADLLNRLAGTRIEPQDVMPWTDDELRDGEYVNDPTGLIAAWSPHSDNLE